MSNLIDKAIEWAEAGIPVFPCGKDKSPLTSNGFKDAVTDPKKVRSLFEFYGDAAQMIGGRMGDGLFAVDVDTYKGDEPKMWLKERIDNGDLPETRVHETKNGGLHFIYEGEVGSCNPANGVEVKGEGGYIILPGTPGYNVRSEGVARAPESLLNTIRAAISSTRGSTESQLKSAVLSGADFHNSLTTLAARWSFDGMELVDIQANLLRLLDTSTAKDPNHERHHRWRKLHADAGGELSRIASSAYNKFNTDAVHEAGKDLGGNFNYDELDEVTKKLFNTPQNFEPHHRIFEDETKDPFEGQGYDAHEEVNVLDSKFSMYPILAEDETVIISADPKTGKTALMLTLALNIACGYDYGSFKTHEAGPTLYYGLEGRSAIRKRVAAWKKIEGEKRKLPDVIPLKVVEKSTNFFNGQSQDVAAAQIVAYNKYCINKYGTALKAIFIDTLTKAMIGGDQNSADDTAQLFNIVPLIRDQGITAPVVFVHHNSKDGRTRGSGNIEAEADMILGVTKKGDTVHMRITRARSVEDGMQFTFAISAVDLGENVQGYKQEGIYLTPIGELTERDQTNLHDDMTVGERRAAITKLGSNPSAEEVVDAWFLAGLIKGRTIRGTKLAPSLASAHVQEALEKVANDIVGVPYGQYMIKTVKKDGKVVGFQVGEVTY